MAIEAIVRIRLVVRTYEVDDQGHVNGAAYLNYAEHARWECLRAAGIARRAVREHRLALVHVEERVRHHREVRAGDHLELSTMFVWGDGETFGARTVILLEDGTLAAEVTATAGLLDLGTRHMVPDPAGRLRDLATAPGRIGLGGAGADRQDARDAGDSEEDAGDAE